MKLTKLIITFSTLTFSLFTYANNANLSKPDKCPNIALANNYEFDSIKNMRNGGWMLSQDNHSYDTKNVWHLELVVTSLSQSKDVAVAKARAVLNSWHFQTEPTYRKEINKWSCDIWNEWDGLTMTTSVDEAHH